MIEEFIKSGDLVFDIGANEGVWSKRAIALGAKVVAVEPLQHHVDSLKKIGADVIQAACDSTVGKGNIFYIDNMDVVSSFDKLWVEKHFDQSISAGKDINQVEVSLTTIDLLVKNFGMPDFIKIDVEGAEHNVISGMSKPVKALSFEYHGSQYPHNTSLEYPFLAAQKLLKLANYEFRFTHQQENNWCSDWTNYKGFTGFMENSFWGDVYARMV